MSDRNHDLVIGTNKTKAMIDYNTVTYRSFLVLQETSII